MVTTPATATWAAPASAPPAIAAVAWLLQRGRQRLLIAGIALNIALIGVAYHWPLVLAAVDGQKQVKMNFDARAEGWDDLGRQLQPLLQAHPDTVLIPDNRTLLAHMLYELREINPAAAAGTQVVSRVTTTS